MNKRAAWWSYAAVAAADTLAAAIGERRVRLVTKPLLMPLLAAALPARRPGVDLALAASWAGDVALLGEGDAALVGGIGGFACAHAAYLRGLRPIDGPPRPQVEQVVGAAFALGATAATRTILPRLGERGNLWMPVTGYTVLVTAMGHAAVRAGIRSGDRGLAAGGALFWVSDGLVAASLFARSRNPLVTAAVHAAVMATYTAAQALLASALAAAEPATAGPQPLPTVDHGQNVAS